MSDNLFPESKLEWFLEKFKDEKGEIKASDIRAKGEKKYSSSDWRKLMSLVVQKGYAKDNGKYSKNELLAFAHQGQKMGAPNGKHDDCVMSLAFALSVSPFKPGKKGFFDEVQLSSIDDEFIDCRAEDWEE